MSVSGIGGGISPLRGMEGVQAGGALGEHKVEQIENTRAEPRQTSIGSKIAAFFKGIGAFFANLKAEHTEAKAARKEAKAEREVTAAAKAFAESLAVPRPTPSSDAFAKVMAAAVQWRGPEEGMTVALGKMLDAIEDMPDLERTFGTVNLMYFNNPDGLGAKLTEAFDTSTTQAMQQALDQDAMLRDYGLPGTLSSSYSVEGQREAFVGQLAAFGEAVTALFDRQAQVDNPVDRLQEGRLDDVLFDKLDQAFAKKFADENTKFIKAVNDWKGGMAGGDATLARDGFEALMDRFVRDTGSTQVDVTDQVMARLNAVADGSQPLTQDVFDDAVTWLATSLRSDMRALPEFRRDPAVRAYVHYGKTSE